MAETKKCRMCKNDIDRDAKKCPFCRSFQNWMFRPFVYGIGFLTSFLLFAFVFGAVLYDILDTEESFEDYPDALAVTESKLNFGDRNGESTVVIVGKIQNKSNVDWEYLRLQVNCYNRQSELFDTHQDSCYSLMVPAGITVPFKVSFVREFPESNYTEHEVVAIHAKDEDRY